MYTYAHRSWTCAHIFYFLEYETMQRKPRFVVWFGLMFAVKHGSSYQIHLYAGQENPRFCRRTGPLNCHIRVLRKPTLLSLHGLAIQIRLSLMMGGYNMYQKVHYGYGGT